VKTVKIKSATQSNAKVWLNGRLETLKTVK
jgi:hypothetical protein